MPRQTSIQLTESTEQQVSALQSLGFGTFTDIVRIAIDRMHMQERPRNADRTFHLVARTNTVYDEVRNFFGDDASSINIVQAIGRHGRPVAALPADHVVIGSVTAHPQSGPWFALTAPADTAEQIIAKHP